ncbi:MAG: CbtB-domain containing protein [Alphaproteobacteria bacterium]|nr:MAG: CbtB-domain containing protein [Alphaproteobacteria bacterium]
MTSTQTTANQTPPTAASRSRAETGLAGILVAALTGVVLIYFAGFANSAVLHDTAHDTRHATGFPCH